MGRTKAEVVSKTLFEKLWDAHVIRDYGDGWSLLHVDRSLIHDLSGPDAFRSVRTRGLLPSNPELAVATPDHAVSSQPGRGGRTSEIGAPLYDQLRQGARENGIQLLDIGSGAQGIVHVVGPETGWVLPGLTVACGDSHTCTNGALGALAIGIGTSEVAHVLATQTLRLKRPRNMRVRIEGRLAKGVAPKDVILYVIQTLGTAAGVGYAVEFSGSTIRDMSVEGRLTICNMAVELGARFGVIAPDQNTFEYLKHRPFAPTGTLWGQAIEAWSALFSDPDADFDREVCLDASHISPTITWGTSPEQAIQIDAPLPRPEDVEDGAQHAAMLAAFEYMGLRPGQLLLGEKVDWVFIGSCNNSRLSDLRSAAEIIKGRSVAEHVQAWVVPGSEEVQRQAEAEGLDLIFRAAGFEWRDAGCSMCAASNGERVPPLARCISTSNRNFVGRQGPRARTHLASPQTAAAAAVAGAVVDVRRYL